jgi:hypothetical protein
MRAIHGRPLELLDDWSLARQANLQNHHILAHIFDRTAVIF